jgi:RNA polymerase sigma factor (sigma-70 family)
MAAGGSVSTWLMQLKGGDVAALAKLHQRYWQALVGMARQKLNGAPSRAADEEDVAQEAFLGFCASLKAGRLPVLHDRHDFLALLTHIVACKAHNQIKHEFRDKRPNPNRFVDESVLFALADENELSPLQQALINDCYDHFVLSLSENLREYAVLHLAGHSNAEIARQLNRSEQTIGRKLDLIRTKWQRMAAQSLREGTKSLEDPPLLC